MESIAWDNEGFFKLNEYVMQEFFLSHDLSLEVCNKKTTSLVVFQIFLMQVPGIF